jgi:hypothetical protein
VNILEHKSVYHSAYFLWKTTWRGITVLTATVRASEIPWQTAFQGMPVTLSYCYSAPGYRFL